MKPIKTYFLKNNVNSLVKIGRSNDVEKRVTQIVGQCKFIELSIFCVLDGNHEAYFHELYREYRKEGEWFEIPDLTVEKIVQQYNKIVKPQILEPKKTIREELPILDLETLPERITEFIVSVKGAVHWAAFFHYLEINYSEEHYQLIDVIIRTENVFMVSFEDKTGTLYVGAEGYIKINDPKELDYVGRLCVYHENKKKILTFLEEDF